jgi:hypothetical protein
MDRTREMFIWITNERTEGKKKRKEKKKGKKEKRRK